MKDNLLIQKLIDQKKKNMSNLAEIKKNEIESLKNNLSLIKSEGIKREENLRNHIKNLSFKVNSRDYNYVKNEMLILDNQINSNINQIYSKSKVMMIKDMHDLNNKKDILLKNSFLIINKSIEDSEKQQHKKFELINKSIETNHKLKENYLILKEKCKELKDDLNEMRKKIIDKFELNCRLFFVIYSISKHIFILKHYSNNKDDNNGIKNIEIDENLMHNLVYGKILGHNEKNEYLIKKYSIDMYKSTKEKRISSIIENIQKKKVNSNKINNKILSNLLNMLENQKKINNKFIKLKKEDSKRKNKFYLNTLFDIIKSIDTTIIDNSKEINRIKNESYSNIKDLTIVQSDLKRKKFIELVTNSFNL